MRTLRWFLTAAVVVSMVGAASVALACDGAKSASAGTCAKSASAATCAKSDTKMASAEGHCSAQAKMASAGHCSAAAKAECAEKASTCTIHQFVKALNDHSDGVTVTLHEVDSGMEIVFASADQQNREMAQAMAEKAYNLINKPAACSATRAEMAKGCCDGCGEILNSFAGADITFEKNETGAVTRIATETEGSVEKLHAFFKDIQDEAKTNTEG